MEKISGMLRSLHVCNGSNETCCLTNEFGEAVCVVLFLYNVRTLRYNLKITKYTKIFQLIST